MGKHTKGGGNGRTYGDGKGPGYKNISPKHQWQKGNPSPNRKGRPPKPKPAVSKDGMAALLEILNGKITASGPDGPIQVEVWDMISRRIANTAMNDGDFALKLLKVRLDHERLASKDTPTGEDWSDEDEALLQEQEADLARRIAMRGDPQDDDGSDNDE